MARQASNIEDLAEVIRISLSVMSKQWSDGMHMFHEKFNCLSSLIIDHGNSLLQAAFFLFIILFFLAEVFALFYVGLDSTPQEEFLSLLGGTRTSPPIHQFLVNSLGEAVCFSFVDILYRSGF